MPGLVVAEETPRPIEHDPDFCICDACTAIRQKARREEKTKNFSSAYGRSGTIGETIGVEIHPADMVGAVVLIHGLLFQPLFNSGPFVTIKAAEPLKKVDGRLIDEEPKQLPEKT